MKKIFYGVIVNCILSFFSFFYVSFLLDIKFNFYNYLIIFLSRQLTSFLLFNDFNLSWSKASVTTAYIKVILNTIALLFYFSIFKIFEINIPFSLIIFEFNIFLFLILSIIYTYRFVNISSSFLNKKKVVIYGAGRAGINIQNELHDSKIIFFIDDDKNLKYRSIDGIPIISPKKLLKNEKINLKDITLIIALPSASNNIRINIYEKFKDKVKEIKILPSVDKIS